jgi:hypothetical protein
MSEHILEPKHGWGCDEKHLDKEKFANELEELHFDTTWKPHEVVRYITRLLRGQK